MIAAAIILGLWIVFAKTVSSPWVGFWGMSLSFIAAFIATVIGLIF